MENNIAVRTEYDPSGLSSLTAEAATSSPNGDAFSAVFASHSRTNFFEGQWGDDSKAMFENLMRQFDDELKDTKPDGGSKPPGSARRSSLPTGDKVCPEIVTEQKMVNGELKDVDFVLLHGRCNSDNSNGSNNSGQANSIPITRAPPPTPNPNMAPDPKLAEPEKGTQTLDYIKDSLEQLALGNYTDKVTVLGTGAQIATGLLGLDLPADIRDLTHDLTHWQWSWGHVGQTLLDGVGMLPVVGSIKYLDEAGALVKGAAKHVDETADIVKDAENAIDKISDIKGGIFKSEDANVLENLEKTETKGYNRTNSLESPKTAAPLEYSKKPKPSDKEYSLQNPNTNDLKELRKLGVNPLKTGRLRSEMSKSSIGKQVLDAADKDIINLSTDASKVSDKGLMGESIGKNGWVYVRNTQSYAKTSETLVHEGVHALGVGGSKRAEALARLAEAQHRGDKINIGKLREVLKDIKDAEVYENMPWRKGGTSEHFPGLEF